MRVALAGGVLGRGLQPRRGPATVTGSSSRLRATGETWEGEPRSPKPGDVFVRATNQIPRGRDGDARVLTFRYHPCRLFLAGRTASRPHRPFNRRSASLV